MPQAELELRNVTIRFGGLTAVNNVTLSIGTGDLVGLIGPNGAGKTTLFNAISGLVRPTQGEIAFEGRDILRASLHQRARLGLGRTFQVPQPMHELTVRENLRVAQRFGAGKIDEARLDEILAFVGLDTKAHRNAATELALTELKALEVGKALATQPKLLLLDEVLGGLETASKRRFMSMLQEVHERYQIGILIIEHDIETVMNLCRRVCVLNFGELIADGPPAEVFRDPAVVKSYTGEAIDA
ncbi:ABC transporter ATP-binding protein [Paraburkholderia acidisoli]|uniref:ATP-binding cassette domain-containing protein n=1 Tax=Paraburkholderia acidisoli TaxID=2571748 RepID=A0A7Z2GJK8_9BURK|nr:ABC transporter ATP-binding protein [Paraburkholderia acidisoli]QGZ63033.1 ATP-binding cassette domain-containing protein [Paraburkholderia acidisoli]